MTQPWLRSLSDFRKRCIKRLVKLRNIAVDAKKHDDAIGDSSDAQKLDPMNLNKILLEYSNEVWVALSYMPDLVDLADR